MKIVVMTPKYGDYDPRTKESIFRLKKELPYISFTFLSVSEVYIHAARRKLLQEALKLGPFDQYIWLDSDIEFTPQDVSRLISVSPSNPFKAYTGLYFTRHTQNHAMACLGNDFDGYTWIKHWQTCSLVEIDACGFGFFMLPSEFVRYYTSTYRPTEWFDSSRWNPGKFPPHERIFVVGEDIDFCEKARRIGLDIFLDTSVILTHKGVGLKEFLENKDKQIPHCTVKEEVF